MTKLFFAGALTLLLTGGAAAAPGTAVSTVNLRAESNTTSEILGKIPAGARLEVGDCTAGWCAVTWQGKSGFAIQTALDMSGRAVRAARRALPPGVGPNDDFEPVAPGYVARGPAIVYGPGPYAYGPGSYWGGPYWGPRWGYGWRRW
jgi:hypothetical protein